MLSAAAVKAAKARAKSYEIDAGKCDGLKLRVRASGAKSWVLRYRIRGERRRLTLGSYPAMSLAAARKAGARAWNAIAEDRDPAAEKREDREAMRMVDLFGVTDPENPLQDSTPGWYLGTYAMVAGANGTAKSLATIASDRYRIMKHLRSQRALMRKRVEDVTLADLNRVKEKAGAGTWRKLRAIIRVAFRHAVDVGAIEASKNPAERTKATADKKCERFLAPEERQRLDAALTRAEERGPKHEGGLAPAYVRLFRILCLTGIRLGEALDLHWEQIDWRHKTVRYEQSKTGAKTVPLTAQGVAFLRKERGSAIRKGRVCTNDAGGRLSNAQRAWRVLRKAAKLEDVRIHDLRHSWASDAISAGVPLYVVGRALGHRSPQTTARYAHLHDQAIQEGLAKAGAAIEAATRGE